VATRDGIGGTPPNGLLQGVYRNRYVWSKVTQDATDVIGVSRARYNPPGIVDTEFQLIAFTQTEALADCVFHANPGFRLKAPVTRRPAFLWTGWQNSVEYAQ
jgi:hypothetical protein